MDGQESLGKAVLYLTVNDEALKAGIRRAKDFVRKELGQAFSGAIGGGGRGRSSGDQLQATRIITRRLGDDLQRLADRGVNVTKQFKQLNQAIKAAEQGQTQTARARNKAVSDFIRQENRAYAATKRRNRISAESTFQSPIRGSLRQPGSPIFSTRGASQGGARESIDALFQAQKRRYALDQKIRALEAEGVRTDALRTRLGKVTTAQAQRRFGLAKKLGAQLDFDLRKERDKLRTQQKQRKEIEEAAPRSPIRGTKDIPGSPAFIAEQARRRAIRRRNLEGRISSGLVGGAFPLLFGQGVGAAIGGGLGGLAGGSKFGFGLSLVGTLLGSAFDEAINKAKTLAAALDDPISNFDALRESALLSSRSVEKQAKALIDSGRAAEASALILQDLSARFGDAGNAKELLDATDTINRQWSELSTTLGILSAGPLSNLADLFTRLLGPAQAQLAFEQRVTGLKPEQAAEARKFRESELRKLPSFANEEQYKQVDIRALQFIEERFGKSKAQLDIENKIETSKATQLGIDSARVAIAREEDRILSLQLQKRQAQLEEEKALQALGDTPAQAAVDKIKLDTKVKLLEIERQISEEVNRRDEKQKKAAQDLQNLRLQNIKFLGRGEKQALIKQVGQPAIQEAQRRGVTLRSFSDIRDFAQFLERERTLQNEAGPALINSNQDLRTSLESTAEVVRGLVSSVDTLSNKEWNITVTVPGQNSSQKQDLVNSLG